MSILPTVVLLQDLIRQLDDLKINTGVVIKNPPEQPTKDTTKKRVKPIQLTGFSPTQWTKSLHHEIEKPSNLGTSKHFVNKVNNNDTTTLELDKGISALTWMYLYAIQYKSFGNDGILKIEHCSLNVEALRQQLGEVPFSRFICLPSHADIIVQPQANMFKVFDERKDSRSLYNNKDTRLYSNQQKLKDLVLDLILRTNPQDHVVFKKKSRIIADTTQNGNLNWLAGFLIDQCGSMKHAPTTKSPSSPSDKLSRLESRLTTSTPPTIQLPFEDMTHGEAALYLLISLADSYKLTCAILDECNDRIKKGFSVRIASRLLLSFEQSEFDFTHLATKDTVGIAIDRLASTGHLVPNLHLSRSPLESFYFSAFYEHFGEATKRMYTIKDLGTFTQNPIDVVTAFACLPPIQLLSPPSSNNTTTPKPRKVRPIPVESDGVTLASPPFANPIIAENLIENSIQGELRRWFWWRHPKLKEFSDALVNILDGCNNREQVIKAVLKDIASAQDTSEWTVSTELVDTWILLTKELLAKP